MNVVVDTLLKTNVLLAKNFTALLLKNSIAHFKSRQLGQSDFFWTHFRWAFVGLSLYVSGTGVKGHK